MSDEWRDFVRKKTGRKRTDLPPRPTPGRRTSDSQKAKRPTHREGSSKMAREGSGTMARGGSGKARRPQGSGEPTGDLGQRIQDEARVVPLDKLKKGGTKFVRVISPETIVRIVGESLENALAEHSFLLDEDERKLIAKEARLGFSQLLIRHKQLQEEAQQLQGKLDEEVKARGKQEEQLERQIARMREQLESEQSRLASEKQRAEGVHIAPASMDELQKRLEATARRLVDEDELGLPAEGDPVPGLATFREQFAGAVAEVLRAERQRFGVSGEAQETIELLERRVAKLSRALEEKQDDLIELTGDESRAKESYYEASAGLSPAAKRFEWKAEILKRGMLQTQELLGKEVSDQERAAPFPKRHEPKSER